ncbi:hypothetical protein HYC85_029411 [Camellia sinensis]|uniref:Aminotransferase-like plant mobile domain-containing protein n=1 Tax=Camellia sinensis TaxID=4442 RepID=A0A7J7FXX7_CAMSI|nr:hypothetical protein HYC85_029411 [Camellia sinensis]
MEEFLAQNLTTWIASLDGSEKLNFRGFGINALFTLGHTPLHLPFLHAAARFWNPVTHVFSFAGQEIYPTFEDFRALMESERDEELLPQLNFGHAQSLGRMCGLSMRDARSLICDGMLDISSLTDRFSDAGSGGSSVRLTEVAQGLKEGKSRIAMTLAEMLMGLDAFYRHETTRLAGSPLLLQVWLMDKLQIVDSCPAYLARGYFFRHRLVNALDEGWWFAWMCRLSADRITWRCPWLSLPAMSYNMPRHTRIQLIGLTHCAFYFPFRIRRQFGHDQTCPPEGIEYPAAFPARSAQLAWQATAWRTRELLAAAPTLSCTLSDECLDWLNEEAQVGPILASEASTSSGRGRRST